MTTQAIPGNDEIDVLATVRAATAEAEPPPAAPRRFRLQQTSLAERILAPLLGLYLGYVVVRLPEVFPALEIPKGPMVVTILFMVILGTAIAPEAWRLIWRSSIPLRLVAGIVGLALLSIPIGIWPSGSFDYFSQRYLVAIVVFVSCLVFLRDPRAMRNAVAIFVISVTAVSAHVVKTYDPNAPVYKWGEGLIDPRIVAERPELTRLKSVGASLDPNDFGAILATTLPLALWLSVGSLWRRLFWTAAAGVMVMAIVPTQSRGSMLGMVAAVSVIIGAGASGWRRWLTIAIVGAGIAVFISMATGIGAAGRFSDFSGSDYNLSNQGRWYFWRQGFVWMLKRPWGYGLDNYPIYFGSMNGEDRSAHSTWVQYGVELGVAGLVLFVALCRHLINGLRSHRAAAARARLSNNPVAATQQVQAGHMLAVLAGALVTGTFLSNAYYSMTYMALGLAAATLLGSPFAAPLADTSSATPATAVGRRRRPPPPRMPFREADVRPHAEAPGA